MALNWTAIYLYQIQRYLAIYIGCSSSSIAWFHMSIRPIKSVSKFCVQLFIQLFVSRKCIRCALLCYWEMCLCWLITWIVTSPVQIAFLGFIIICVWINWLNRCVLILWYCLANLYKMDCFTFLFRHRLLKKKLI